MATATPTGTDLTLASATSTVLHAAGAVLGESPIATDAGGVAYVDIEGRAVWVLPAGFNTTGGGGGGGGGGGAPYSIPTPLPVGGVTATSRPGVFLVSQPDAVHLLDTSTRTLGPPLAAIPPAHALPGTRFNDGLASPQGTWVGGRLHKDWRNGKRGRVYALLWEEGEGEGGGGAPTLKPVLGEDEVGMANGMAWAGGGTVFYLADSAAKAVLAFAADPATGVPISGTGRVAVSTATLGGAVPDGLCIDDAGRLWIALAETGCVAVVAPDAASGGVEVGRLACLPFTRLTSCAWGRKGEDRGRLLVTSRAPGDASPAAGALVSVAGSGGRGSSDRCGVVRLPPGAAAAVAASS